MKTLDLHSRYKYAQAVLQVSEAVANGGVFPSWIDARHFWYERRSPDGVEYRIVNADCGSTVSVVSKAVLVAALSNVLEKELDIESIMALRI